VLAGEIHRETKIVSNLTYRINNPRISMRRGGQKERGSFSLVVSDKKLGVSTPDF